MQSDDAVYSFIIMHGVATHDGASGDEDVHMAGRTIITLLFRAILYRDAAHLRHMLVARRLLKARRDGHTVSLAIFSLDFRYF